MYRLSVCMGLILIVSGACKGKSKYRDSPETVRKLEDCETSEEEKKQYIVTLERRIADLEGQGGMVTVNIEGEAMKIFGTGPSGGTVKGNADDAALYEAFVAALRRSRGSIQKCYQNALKNNAGLQGREVTLDIQVGYQTSGKVAGAQFSPRIDTNFDKCMKTVANRWTLPAMPNAVSFNYKQTLKPE